MALAELTFLSLEIPFLSISVSKNLYCRDLNSQAEQADSLIDSIIQVLDIQYTDKKESSNSEWSSCKVIYEEGLPNI
jgi:hypothetical protein